MPRVYNRGRRHDGKEKRKFRNEAIFPADRDAAHRRAPEDRGCGEEHSAHKVQGRSEGGVRVETGSVGNQGRYSAIV
jgi:hypothetical protein